MMAPASSNQPSDSKENPHTLLTNSSSVRVAVRIRPNPTSQQDHASHLKPFSASTLSVICPDSNSSLFSPSENPNAISSAVVAAAADVLWEYDSVWPQDSTQDHIFESEVEPLVNAFVQGFNATLFAYGQTGSGKSYTMGTSIMDATCSPLKRPPSSSAASAMKSVSANSKQSGRSTPMKPSTPVKPKHLQTVTSSTTETSARSLTNAIASITPSDSAISLSDLSATSGMVSRAIHAIFAKLEETRACDCTQSLSIKVSFLELHNEEWVDLLKEKKKPNSAKSSSAKPTTSTNYCHDEVTIREDKDGRLFIHGATSILVSDAESALKLLAKGSRLRTTAATSMNETSSRSHAIFSLSLTILQMTAPMSPLSISDRSTIPNENRGLVITSKFHFVDLAGSERLKRTQSVGDRKTEGISINQGLLVLGRVINCLSEMKPNATEAVVPYRDSKLTRFLQDSLGGNSKTVMLACVSSLEADLPESINTLRYASRARGIQNKSKITVDSSGASSEVLPLLAEISSLKSMLADATLAHTADQLAILNLQRDLERTKSADETEREADLREENAEMHRRVAAMESKIRHAKETFKTIELKLKTDLVDLRKEGDALLVQISELKQNTDFSHLEIQVSELNRSLKKSQDYIALMEDNIATYVRDAAALKAEKSSWVSEKESMRERIEHLHTVVEESETNLQGKLRCIAIEQSRASNIIEEKEKEIKLLKETVSIERAERAKEEAILKSRIASLVSNLETFTKHCNTWQASHEILDKKLKESETSSKEDEEANKLLIVQGKDAEAEKKALRDQMEALSNALSNSAAETIVQIESSKLLQTKLLESEGRQGYLENEVKELHRILEAQSKELACIQHEKCLLSENEQQQKELINATADALIQQNIELHSKLEKEQQTVKQHEQNALEFENATAKYTEKLEIAEGNYKTLETLFNEKLLHLSSTEVAIADRIKEVHTIKEDMERIVLENEELRYALKSQTLASPTECVEKWYIADDVGKTMNRSSSNSSLVKRRIAEYSGMKEVRNVTAAHEAGQDDNDADLINRYQYLLSTVRGVKDLFES